MKKIFKISALLLTLFIGASCENDDQTIVAPSGGPELLSPADGNTYVLLPENASNEVTTLVWNHADYGVQTEINYDVEVALTDTDFATIVSGGITTNRYYTWTSEQLNTIILALGGVPYVSSSIDVRIKSSLGTNGDVVNYSNIITLTVTPYTTETPKLYVIGNFLNSSGYGDDWTTSTSLPTLASSGYGLTDFEGYVYMNVASPEFKLLPTNSSFDGDYGDDGTFTGVLLQDGEVNIQLSAASYYKITANTGTMTYTTTATQWAVTGSATTLGWPAGPDGTDGQDVNLTYNMTTKKWEVITTLTGGQEIKFRANNAWSLNYGDTGADGSLNEGGDNIAISTTGSYLIELDLSNPREYTYTLTPQ